MVFDIAFEATGTGNAYIGARPHFRRCWLLAGPYFFNCSFLHAFWAKASDGKGGSIGSGFSIADTGNNVSVFSVSS